MGDVLRRTGESSVRSGLEKQVMFGIGIQKILYFSGKQNFTRTEKKPYLQKHFNNYYGLFPLFLLELIDSTVCIA